MRVRVVETVAERVVGREIGAMRLSELKRRIAVEAQRRACRARCREKREREDSLEEARRWVLPVLTVSQVSLRREVVHLLPDRARGRSAARRMWLWSKARSG